MSASLFAASDVPYLALVTVSLIALAALLRGTR